MQACQSSACGSTHDACDWTPCSPGTARNSSVIHAAS
jgi:hypothetical protein